MRDMAQAVGAPPPGMVRPFEETKTISIEARCPRTLAVKLGVAELSLLDFSIAHDELGGDIVRPGQAWYWFARLYVPPSVRRMKIATRLMESLVEWADARGGWNPPGHQSLRRPEPGAAHRVLPAVRLCRWAA